MDTTRWPEGSYKETIIGPAYAFKLLKTVHPTSQHGIVPEVVDLYTHLMKTGQWVPQYLSSPGHPILIKGDELIYGVQRLMACIRANYPFDTVLVQLPANHQGYY